MITARRAGVLVALSLARGVAAQGTQTPGSWAIASELGLNAARGNSSYTMLSTGLRFTHLDKNQFEFESASALTYGESNNAVIARRLLTSVKGDFHPRATWSPFVFGSVERDRIRRLDLLGNAGAGLKYTFFRDSAGAASFSLAGLYSYKNVVPVVAAVDTDATQKVARVSFRPKVVQKYRSGFSVEQTTFWQPAVNDFGDYMVDAATRLGYSPNKISTLFAQHTYRFDSRPPTGIGREDQLFLAGLKLSF
jgi:hypothetical protein